MHKTPVDPLDWLIRIYSPTAFYQGQDTNYNFALVFDSLDSTNVTTDFWYIIQPCALQYSSLWYIVVTSTSSLLSNVKYSFNFTYIPADTVYPIVSGFNIAPPVNVLHRNPITYYSLQTDSQPQQLTVKSFLQVASYGGINICTSKANTELDLSGTLLSTAPNQTLYVGFDATYVNAPTVTFKFNTTLVDWDCRPPDSDISNVCPTSNYPTNAWQGSFNSVYIIQYLLDIMQANNFTTCCFNAMVPILCGLVFPKCNSNNFPVFPCQSDCYAIRSNCSEDFKRFGEVLPVNKNGFFDLAPSETCPVVSECFVYYENFDPYGTVSPNITTLAPSPTHSPAPTPANLSLRSTLSLAASIALLVTALFF